MSSSTGSFSDSIKDCLIGRTDNSVPSDSDDKQNSTANPGDENNASVNPDDEQNATVNPDAENNASVNPDDEQNSSGNPKETKPTHKKDTVSKRKSNAGRKKIDEAKKKKQLVLTLTPDTYNALKEWATTKPRSAANYASDFIEEHLNDIIK